MASNKLIIHVLVLPVLIAFAIIAGVSLSQIQYLSLPISSSTPTAALILPLLTGIAIRGAQSILTGSDDSLLKRRSPPTWILPAGFLVLVIFDTVLATLAVTEMLPSSGLTCQLSERWISLWSSRNANGIKRIQDAHDCCGLRTIKDHAWPFAGNQGADACEMMYGRNRNCLPAWRRNQQINAGLILLVAVGTFLVKGGVLILYRGRTPLIHHVRRGYAALTTGEDGLENGDHRTDEPSRSQGRIEAPYRDEIGSDTGTEHIDTRRIEQGQAGDGSRRDSNMVLQPSNIRDSDNEWRG